VLGLRGEREAFAEDIQAQVAPDEPHEVVMASVGLGQGNARRDLLRGEAEGASCPLEGGQGRLATELRVTGTGCCVSPRRRGWQAAGRPQWGPRPARGTWSRSGR
jgi:hypothetical protein